MVCCIGGKEGFVLNLCSTPVEIEYLKLQPTFIQVTRSGALFRVELYTGQLDK